MKTKVKRMSKKSLALFLGIVMLITSIGLGSLITFNAATYHAFYVTNNSKNMSGATHSEMTAVGDGTYYFSFTTSNSNFDIVIASSNPATTSTSLLSTSTAKTGSGVTVHNIEEGSGYYWLVGYANSGTTVYIIYDPSGAGSITATTTAPTGGSGNNDSIAEAPADVLNGTNIMFYICSYEDDDHKDADLTNGTANNKPTYGSDRGWTWMKKGDACVQIAKTDRTTYFYITNNASSWAGNVNNGIKTATGGETFYANSQTGTNGAVSGTTTLSSNTVKVANGSLKLSTNASAAKSSYDKDLYYLYYLDNGTTSLNTGNAIVASTSSKTYTVSSDVFNSLSPGTPHTKFNRTTDILGNPLASADLTKDPLYVISTGYVQNVAGDYSTEWRVYRKNGTSYSLVTGGGKNSIPPSLLFMTNSASFSNSVYPTNTHSFSVDNLNVASPNSKPSDYLTLYNTLSASYAARPVYVSYEKNDRTTKTNYGGSGETMYGAWRLDGRWFYTSAGDLIDSKIEIQYLDGAGGYKTESSYVTGFQNKENKGEHTGAIAYFTDGAFYGERDSGSVVLDKTKSFSMEAQAAEGYEFVGWYIKQGDAYPSMNPTNKTAVTATTSRTSSFTFVARYKKLTKGNLVVSNNVATGTVDGITYNGTGKGLLTVQYTTNGGSSWTTLGTAATENDVTVGTDILTDANLALGNNFQLKVTLGNTPDGEDTFGRYKNVYSNRTSTTANQAYTINLAELFTATTVDQSTVYEQNVFSLPFQTYFVQHVYAYSIVYSYTSTRLTNNSTGAAAQQSFTKTGTFTSAQLKDYVTGSGDSRRLTDAFITEVKPKESNFRQNMAFAVTNKGLTNSGSTTTFTATAAYTNSTNNAVSVTLDIPYRIEDRTADEGYDLTPVETDREYKISGEEGYTSGQDHYRINDTIPTFEVSDDSGYGAYLTNTAELTTTLPDEESTFFLTAPESIYTYDSDLGEDVETKFSYWLVTDTSNNEIVKVYNVKFNYRIFDNYRIKPVYDGVKDVSGDFNKKATITYAGTTRNQWNNSNNGGYTISGSTATAANEASDILFNDFIIAFNYMDRQVKYIDNAECGIVLEKIGTIVNDSRGNPITDMGTYAEKAADNTDKITTYISSGFANAGGLTLNKYNNLKDNLNDKNRIEFFYNSYNSYGSTASGNLVQRTVASSNVFRAYSYMKIGDEVILSTPVYYSMYSEAH